jgi:hypothetical protein
MAPERQDGELVRVADQPEGWVGKTRATGAIIQRVALTGPRAPGVAVKIFHPSGRVVSTHVHSEMLARCATEEEAAVAFAEEARLEHSHIRLAPPAPVVPEGS